MHFVRFEGGMMRKQAAKSKLKDVDITQTVKLQNGAREYLKRISLLMTSLKTRVYE